MFAVVFLVPLLVDPGPPVSLDDRHRFGVLNREATDLNRLATWRAYSNCQSCQESIDYWHLDAAKVGELRECLRWLYEIYDDIDTLAMDIEYDSGQKLRALERLKSNLGPWDYQIGRVPPIPQEVHWK